MRPRFRSFGPVSRGLFPDDLLFAADAAVSGGDLRLAVRALEVLSRSEGQAARAASAAIAALGATDAAGQLRALRLATGTAGPAVGSSASVWRDLQPGTSSRPLSPVALAGN